MASNFDEWYMSSMLPWESRKDARKRYETLYGTTIQDKSSEQKEEDNWFDEWKKEQQRQQKQDEFISDPDFGDQWSAGIDEAQASGASALAGPVSGFLSDYISEDLGSALKSKAEEWRDENLEEASRVARPKSREEILKEDPDSWYKYLPEKTPTGHEIIRQTPTSLAAAGIALPAALVAGKVAGVAGLAGLGKLAVSSVAGMTTGNIASSLQVGGETYERAKNDPLIRQELGVDPDTDFKDLNPEDKQKVDRFATDASQTAFGHRIYTSGAVEMLSFIPYGNIIARWALDTGLGTASEVWDRELYTEDTTKTLVDYGMPQEKAVEFQQKLLDAGPGLYETWWPALVQEGLTGGGFSLMESVVGSKDPKVSIPATSTQLQLAEIKAAEKPLERSLKREEERRKKQEELDKEARARGFADWDAWGNQLKITKRENEQTAADIKAIKDYEKYEADRLDLYKKLAEEKQEKAIAKQKQEEATTNIDEKVQQQAEEMSAIAEAKAKEDTDKQLGEQRYAKDIGRGTFNQIFGITGAQEDTGNVKFSKDTITEITNDIEKRHKKFRGKFKIIDQSDIKELTRELEGREYKNEKGEIVKFTEEQNRAQIEEDLRTARAWTYNGKIYLNADGITGKNNKEVLEQIVQLGMFHEPIAHLGLKEHLGEKKFNNFLDKFYNTNRKEVLNWWQKTLDKEGNPAYLKISKEDFNDSKTRDKFIKNLNLDQKRELAEEYLANVFVEFGVRDPNILARMADSLTTGTMGILGKQRISTVKAREILAEVQREYIGGKRNIITGDFFDRSNWLKPKPDTVGDEKEEVDVKVKDEAKPEREEAVAVDRKTLRSISKAEAAQLSGQKLLPDTSGRRYAKRISSPERRKIWQKLNKPNPIPEIRRRNKELTKLATKVEKGEISFEDYRTQYEKKFPIRTFNNVPKLSSGAEIAGAINQKQYEQGSLIGEDSDLTDGMDTLVRFDVNSMEKYNVGVVTAVSPQSKGSHYGKAAHLVSKKDGTPVKMVTKNLKNVLGIAAGKSKFPMAYFKGQWKSTPAPEIKKNAEKLLNNPNWIQVGMEPKRQSSFYARETKEINGETIEAGTPINTAEEVLQVGMFALAKNPTTKAVPEFVSREGRQVRFAKQVAKRIPTDTSTDPISGMIRYSRKPKHYKAEGGAASWITWADQGNWGIDFGKLKTLADVKEEAGADFWAMGASELTMKASELKETIAKHGDIEFGIPKGIKVLTSVDSYVERMLTPERMEQNQQLRELYRQNDGDKDKIKKKFIAMTKDHHAEINNYNHSYLQQGYSDDPFFASAIMRATNSVQNGTYLDGPPRLEGVALSEVFTEFNAGNYTGPKTLIKDYQERAAKIAEKNTQEGAIATTDGGKWIKLPMVEKSMSTGEREMVFNTWNTLSRDNWCTNGHMGRKYPLSGPMYVFRKEGESLIAIRFDGNGIAEIQSQKNNGTIPPEYLPQVREFTDSPNIKLSSNAKKTLTDAEYEARMLALIEDKKEKGAKWEKAPLIKESFGDFVASEKEGLLTMNLKDGSLLLRLDKPKWERFSDLATEYHKSQNFYKKGKENQRTGNFEEFYNPRIVSHIMNPVDISFRLKDFVPLYGKQGNKFNEVYKKYLKKNYGWSNNIQNILGDARIINVPLSNLENVYGKLIVGDRDTDDVKQIQEVALPKLISVGNELSIGYRVDLPLLKIVADDVDVRGVGSNIGLENIGGKLTLTKFSSLPNLKIIGGDLWDRLAISLDDRNLENVKLNKDGLIKTSEPFLSKDSIIDLNNLEIVKGDVRLGDNPLYAENYGHKISLNNLHTIERSLITGRGVVSYNFTGNPDFPALNSIGMDIRNMATKGLSDDTYSEKIMSGLIEGRHQNITPDGPKRKAKEGEKKQIGQGDSSFTVEKIGDKVADMTNLIATVKPLSEQDLVVSNARDEFIDHRLWVKPKDFGKKGVTTWETVGHPIQGYTDHEYHPYDIYNSGYVPYKEGYDPQIPLNKLYTQKEIHEFREKEFLKVVDELIERKKGLKVLFKDLKKISNKTIEDLKDSSLERNQVKLLFDIKYDQLKKKPNLYRNYLGALQDRFEIPWTTALFPEEIKARRKKITDTNKKLGINAPNLTVVGNDIDVYTSSNFPNLRYVGRGVTIHLDDVSQLNKEFLSQLLPNLSKVGDAIRITVSSYPEITYFISSESEAYGDYSAEVSKHTEIKMTSRGYGYGTDIPIDIKIPKEMPNPFPKLSFVGHQRYRFAPKQQKEFKKILLNVANKVPEDTLGGVFHIDRKHETPRTLKQTIEEASKENLFNSALWSSKEIDRETKRELSRVSVRLQNEARLWGEALKGTVLDPRTKETTRFAKLIKQPPPKVKRAVKVKPDTKETREPTMGININDKIQDFTGQILSGRKTMETRDTDSLRAYVGKEVGIIRTGKGKAQVVGYMTIGEPVVYNNRAEFKKDQSKHLVKTGSDFDIRAGKTKYGYPLTNVRKVSPFPVTTKGIVARKISDPKVRFAKRVGQPTAKELEAEWRKKSVKVKPDTKLPEDKVTLENKKFASGLEKQEKINYKNYVDPRFQKRTSKILMRSASHHALGTRTWNPLNPLLTKWTKTTQPFADKITKRLVAQGTLPDSAEYKNLRREIKGIIQKAEDLGRELYDILKNTKQADVIYKYFTTRDFDPNQITNNKERESAIRAKSTIDMIGKQLVDKGMMGEKTRQKYEGQYLPQVYLKYLLGKKEFNRISTTASLKLDRSYLKKRKDIPESIKLLFGEVKDPAFLASKATTVPIKDMAMLDWLQHISTNSNWVIPKTMVKFDTIGEIKKIIKNSEGDISKETIDDLDLKDTKEVDVSAFWLSKEADRIQSMKSEFNFTPDQEIILSELAKKMKKASDAGIEAGENIDTNLYSKVPDSPKYGMLAGMALRKEIANDIFGSMNLITGEPSIAERWLGDDSLVADYNRLWKWAKVSANPPSYVRNFTSNLILMNMGGVEVNKMPSLIVSAFSDIRKKGKHKGQLHQLAKDLGLTAGTFSNVELSRIEREFKDLQIRLKKDGSTPWAVYGGVKKAFAKFQDFTSDAYGGIDAIGKMMMMKHGLEKRGVEIKDLGKYTKSERAIVDEVAANAEKWLFDYSNTLPSVKYLRRIPFGAPFISFTSFVAPLMLETAITKPWKFAPYYALGFMVKEWFKNNQDDLSEEEVEGLKLGLSEYLREKAKKSWFPAGVIPLPWLDENRRVQWLDISYLYPWGMFSEMAGEIAEGDVFQALKTAGMMGSPALNVASAIMNGTDPFTRQPIVKDPYASGWEQIGDIWWYAFNLTMPPMLHGTGPGNEGFGAIKRLTQAFTGELTKEGEAKFTMGQAVGRMAGFNVTPVAVPEGRNKHLRFEYSQLLKLQRQAKRDITNMYMMQKPKSEIKERINEYKEKLKERVTEFKEKVKTTKPPLQLIKAREEFLKKKKASAQAYRAS